jgi:uncharacterized protein (DUF2236 family)
MDSIIRLPQNLQRTLDAAALDFFNPDSGPGVDFSSPHGEQALIGPESVSWRVFKNPVALWIGGVAAVVLELAEPAVCAAIWQQSSFRRDPLGRLRRTGLAAMITVYGPRSRSMAMIAGIVRMHAKVEGMTAEGERWTANDPCLLNWVQATAAFGFVEAYSRYVRPLTSGQMNEFYREGVPASLLYGATGAPRCSSEVSRLFESMSGRLRPSDSIFQFLKIMADSATLPRPLRWLQGIMVRAAVDLVPSMIRQALGLSPRYGLRPWERPLVGLAGSLANRIVLSQGPAAQACLRLGYPAAHLYS